MSVAPSRLRLTADEYQRMGQVGILSENDRVELIDDDVVAMTPIRSASDRIWDRDRARV